MNEHPPTKRLAILTGNDLAHRYVTNRLCESLPIHKVFVDNRIAPSGLKRIWKKGKFLFINKAARAVFLRLIRDEKKKRIALKLVLGNKCEAFQATAKVEYIQGINTKKSRAKIEESKPTSLLVYGTSIVKPATLDIASETSFNMHTGVSPDYRGTACSFWPVVNNELDLLGATVHECTNDLDGGMIFEIARSSYEKGDSLHTLFAKNVKTGAEAYVRVVKDYLDEKLTGNAQDLTLGNEYRGADLTLFPEIRARTNLIKKKLFS